MTGARERWLPRARAALLSVLLAAGMAALAPAAEAQTTVSPTRYCAGPNLLCQIRPDTTRLTASATQQTVTIRRPGFESGFFAQNFYSAKIEACEWTAVTPGQTGASGTCTTLKDHGVAGIGILNLNFTPTATMISNGGVVITFYWSGLSGVRWANWIPMFAAKAPILSLSPATVAENGGVATVTAEMSSVATSAVTVTVSATAVSPATSSDFTVSTANTLTIAVDGTTVTGLVTVTANDNDMDSPSNSVTVSGTAASSDTGVNTPVSTTLTITDDDAAPDAALALDPASVSENGGISTVTATLTRSSSQPTTVTVAAAAVASSGAVAGDFSLSTAATLTIAAGTTTSAGLVTVTGADNDTDAPDKSVEVTATLANGHGAGTASAATLTLTDDEAAPGVTLSLNPASAAENGGVSTVSATLSHPSTEPSTVTVTPVSGSYTVGTDAVIVIAAGDTTAASDTATVAGVDDDVRQGTAGRSVTVTGTLTNGQGAGAVTGAALTLTDDEAVPTATLVLMPSTILESGGVSTVTAKLSHPTTEATVTLTVTTTAVSPAVPGDFTRAGNTLTIAAGATTSAGLVTVTAVDNNVATGNKQVRVAATASGGGVANPSDATLTLRDDEFGLSESAVSGPATEGGGTATFTVRLNTQPSAAVTVAVTSQDASEGTVSPPSLTFTGGATGNWSTAQTVTVTGVNDNVDDGTVTWQVRLDPSSGDSDYNAVTAVDVDVTTTDDDLAPGVTLSLSPSSIAESGAGNVATVSARLSHPSGSATTVTVTGVTGVFTAGSGAAGTIVIPAEQTTAATDTALVTAVDNDTDAPDRTATVTATVTNARAVADSTTMLVTGASLTVRDDDAAPGAVLAVNPSSVSENGGTATVAAVLSRTSSEPSTVTVTAVSGSYTVGTAATLTIAAGSTVTTDTALVTAVDDAIHQGSTGRSVTVSGTLANGQGAGAVTGASLTLTDDETLPTVALVLGPASISEEGGLSTVTATLWGLYRKVTAAVPGHSRPEFRPARRPRLRASMRRKALSCKANSGRLVHGPSPWRRRRGRMASTMTGGCDFSI